MVSGFTLEKLGLYVVPPYWRHIETGNDFATSSDSKISGFTFHTLLDSLQIYFFPLWRADSKISGFAAEFARCLWTEGVSGKKKLRIQKYPDTCGRGLTLPHFPREIVLKDLLLSLPHLSNLHIMQLATQ